MRRSFKEVNQKSGSAIVEQAMSSIQTIKTATHVASIIEEEDLDASAINNNQKLVVEIAIEDKKHTQPPVVYVYPNHEELERVPSRQSLGRKISQTVAQHRR